jgi:hypothetical protein
MKNQIQLTIDRDGANCGNCPFLDGDNWHRRGMCLLFKEALRGKTEWDDVVAWEACNQCDHVVRNASA